MSNPLQMSALTNLCVGGAATSVVEPAPVTKSASLSVKNDGENESTIVGTLPPWGMTYMLNMIEDDLPPLVRVDVSLPAHALRAVR